MDTTINDKVEVGDVFDVGEKAPANGWYICAPCGYKRRFNKGNRLLRCFKCLLNKRDNGRPYVKNLGLWEFLGE